MMGDHQYSSEAVAKFTCKIQYFGRCRELRGVWGKYTVHKWIL